MKVTVFGATGATGHLVVERALSSGHVVTAFARDPGRMSVVHANLRVIQGDVMEAIPGFGLRAQRLLPQPVSANCALDLLVSI